MNIAEFFDKGFFACTGYVPLAWQRRLFREMLASQLRTAVDISTGLGKTSIIPIWLLALSAQAAMGSALLPRRLVYVVNRRTVVDQASDVAAEIRHKLLANDASQIVCDILSNLRLLCVDPELPLAISTLRGEFADNREWQADPARPAIVVGTVDMIGSRLLFSGYGAGRSYGRSQSAGLLGQDSLIVHDEAHLSPAFGALIRHLAHLQEKAGEPRPVRVLELSATQRMPTEGQNCSGEEAPFVLNEEERQEEPVRQRLTASKALHPVEVDSADNLLRRIVNAALSHRASKARVVIYVRTPELAEQVFEELKNSIEDKKRVGLLTGTLRGHERDKLVKGEGTDPTSHVFLEFRAKQSRGAPPATVFLISTSAGEVGIDLDADHLVCDLTTLDSMIQRLGRVNRLAANADHLARVDVFYLPADKKGKLIENPSKYESARQETWSALHHLNERDDGRFDASPAAIRQLLDGLGTDGIERTFSPIPRIVPCTDVLLDCWALTSVKDLLPARPAVNRWLHGVEADPPETIVVWREEVSEFTTYLAEGGQWTEMVGDWFETHPIMSHERLRDRSDRVAKRLGDIAKRYPNERAITISSGISAQISLPNAADRDRIAGMIIVLPPHIGGFDADSGTLIGKKELPVDDVADVATGQTRARLRALVWRTDDEEWQIKLLGACEDDLDDRTSRLDLGSSWSINEVIRSFLESVNEGDDGENPLIENESRVTLADDENGISRCLLSIGRAICAETIFATSTAGKGWQFLDDHLEWTNTVAACIANRLTLAPNIASAVKIAAQWHDRGKARIAWQRAIGNRRPDEPWAKSGGRGFDFSACPGYRHEFGSLLQASDDPTIAKHPERDLILHLIASHHGWARPHFEERHWDISPDVSDDDNLAAAAEAMRRYTRLQRRFGRWGLAWLEALMKAADAIASARGKDTEQLPS